MKPSRCRRPARCSSSASTSATCRRPRFWCSAVRRDARAGRGPGSASSWRSAIPRRPGRIRSRRGRCRRCRSPRKKCSRVARELPGRAELHLGADARKQFVVDGRLRATPVIHFSSHAVADTRDPDRSRILLAPASPGGPGRLSVSARSERSRPVRRRPRHAVRVRDRAGQSRSAAKGVDGFSRALLAAGAAAAVTTMWDVADRPGAEFIDTVLSTPRGSRLAGRRAASGEAAIPPIAAGVGAPVLLGRLRAHRRRRGAAAAGRAVAGDRRGRRSRRCWLLSAAIRAAGTARRSRSLRRTAGRSRRSAPTP